MDRRFFLKTSGIAAASFGLMSVAPDFLHQFANAQTIINKNGKKKTLIVIFQRGAVDGLNMVVPHGESNYYNLRPNISIPKNLTVNLDGFFGLHPSLKPFEQFWKSKQLAVIHSSGSPNNTRSHFDAQDYMESGTPGDKGTRDGWLNRILQTSENKKDSPFRAVSMTNQVPRSFLGKYPTISMTNLSDFSIKAGVYSKNLSGGFEGVYEQNTKDSLGEAGKETFEAVNYLKEANPSQYKPENGAIYPNSAFGNSLKQIGQLIKANVGLEVAFAEMGGWDTHTNEVNVQNRSQGQIANLLRDFGQSIAALTTDLGKKIDDCLILTMSEFGRTVRENGGRGTDHGHGNAMFLIGNSVKGGKVYGDWKGLDSSNLYEGRDLAVTTDFRDVFAEVSDKFLGNKNFSKLFPNHTVSEKNFRNFIG
ncbi:MAG: DUF1501 domain-containing protein [Pyrinomonadaceae bacterium]|jgi:uncharacterized protein (DUF1501 family)|nr:DUF1501 domain-containing protein [Pyrinomonadaceae bacterium]